MRSFPLFLLATLLFSWNAEGQYKISTIAGGVPPVTPSPAAIAVGYPDGVALSPNGEVYFTSRNCVFRIASNGILTVVAGTGKPGFSGDGGLAINAQVNLPAGLTFDTAGSLYIADTFNSRIRKVNIAGVISTVAGTGIEGGLGDGGPALNAQLNRPRNLATDPFGNLYIVDTMNHRIRRVASGIITAVAGNGIQGYSGEGPATAVSFNMPGGIALNSAGDIFVADSWNQRVRKISGGFTTSIAGTGQTSGPIGLGGPPTAAALFFPSALAFDPQGNLLIAEAGQILKITGQTIGSFAGGSPMNGAPPEGLPAARTFVGPSDMVTDRTGNVYLADYGRIRRIDNSTTIVSTLAGNGTNSWGDGGPAMYAGLDRPDSLAMSPQGELYIGDSQGARVRKISRSGTITTVAGTGTYGYSGDGGPASAAQLCNPRAITFDLPGNLYIGDCNSIRKVTPSGMITTIAGRQTNGFSGDGGLASAASFDTVEALASDSAGNLYVSDFFNFRIRKIDAAGVITTIAGNGNRQQSGDGGIAIGASFYNPNALAVDSSGNVYVADFGSVRKIDRSGIIATVLGKGSASPTGDGGSAAAAPPTAVVIAIDQQNRIFIGGHGVIRTITTAGIVNTLAGDGTSAYAGDGGPSKTAQVYAPGAMLAAADGSVYFSELLGQGIRLLQPLPLQTISFGTIRDHSFGDAPFSLTAAASSGLAVSYKSSTAGVCLVAGATVTLYNAGFCTITASQAGSGDFAPAQDVVQTFTVLRGSQTITFAPVGNPALGTQPFTVQASASSGLPVALSSTTPAVCTLSGSTVTLVAPGKCSIRGDQSGTANYLPAATATVTFFVNGPQITPGGVGPIYSSSTLIQPGSWVSVYGARFANDTFVWDADFPTSLGGVSVSVNGKAAFLWYVSPGQINLQTPDDPTDGPVDLIISGPNGVVSAKVTLARSSASLSLFDTRHAAGVILTPDGSGAYGAGSYDLLGPANSFAFRTRPAHPGETVLLFGVGLGPTQPPVPAGTAFSGSAPTLEPINISIGGATAQVLYSGVISAGLYQVNVVVPNVAPGELTLFMSGNGSRYAGAIVAVQ